MKEIEDLEGMCIYGSMDCPDTTQAAYRKGSADAYKECASLARKYRESGELPKAKEALIVAWTDAFWRAATMMTKEEARKKAELKYTTEIEAPAQ